MARTRGIQPGTTGAYHVDDGELLDKEGKPIPTVAHQGGPSPVAAAETEPPPEPPAEPAGPVRYYCDARTLSRNMDGYEAVLLIDALMGLLPADIEAEKWAALPADLRQHFRRVG